jgi:bacteriorhodopsin
MRIAGQAALWAWIVLAIGWLAAVTWVAFVESIEPSTHWVYAMTAVVPPGSVLAIGAALSWTARAFRRNASLIQ